MQSFHEDSLRKSKVPGLSLQGENIGVVENNSVKPKEERKNGEVS